MYWQRTRRLYIDAFSNHPREIWVLAWLTLINRAGTMVLPFLSVYATTILGFSLKEAGLIMAFFGLGSFGGSYFGGKLSDTIGGRKVIIASLAFSGLGFISIQWASTLPQLMLAIFITALLGEAYRPAMSTLVAQYVPKQRFGRSMSFIRLAINLGFSAGPTLGGIIAVSLGYSWLFWIDGLTCMLGAIYFAWASWNWTVEKTSRKERKVQDAKGGLPPLRNLAYVLFLISTLLMAFSFIQWFHTVPVFLKTEWHYAENIYGLMMGAGSLLIVLIEMPIIHLVEEGGHRKSALRWGLLLLALSFVCFQLPPTLMICFVASFFMVMGEIFYLPLNNSYSLLLSPDNRRGAYMSWYWMTWSTANVLGPSLGFFLIDSLGFAFFWGILIVLLGTSFLINQRIHAMEDVQSTG